MTEGVIWKQLLFFAFPLFLSNVLQQLYSSVDALFVGNYVDDFALAAVGSTGSLAVNRAYNPPIISALAMLSGWRKRNIRQL